MQMVTMHKLMLFILFVSMQSSYHGKKLLNYERVSISMIM